MLRAVQIGLWALAAAAVGVLAYLQWERSPSPERAVAEDIVALMNRDVAVGGAFRLIDQSGRPFTEADLVGRPTALFFGFITCPDICPTTLATLATLKAQLGPQGDDIQVVFVTVDPERDTPEQLSLYLSSFSLPVIGLTGAETDLAAMREAYFAHARRVPLESGGYTMDHTSLLYLLDRQGRFVEVRPYGEDPQATLAALRALLT